MAAAHALLTATIVCGAEAAEGGGWEKGYYQKLSLSSGQVDPQTDSDTVEPLGPLMYFRSSDTVRTWAFTPLFSYTKDEATDFAEFDFVYPLLSLDRFGTEYRFHIAQLFAFAGGQTQTQTNYHRFTLFPVYFQQRSSIPELNYTAVIPFYGHLQNRIFRDEIKWVMLPIYIQTRKRDMVTDNYFYPFFHLRHGTGLTGWQFWPFYGREHKEITTATNDWGEPQIVGGHDERFVLWPIYVKASSEIGTDNPVRQQAILPFYSSYRSPRRDSITAPWPIGYTHTEDREKKYTEIGAPWPLIVFAHGSGKHTSRVFPFYSRASTGVVESDFYLWPVYKYNRINSAPLDRERTRILFFLFSNTSDKNTETGERRVHTDLLPFFTRRRELNGDATFQILTILEPFLPNNKSVDRNYSPVWALWRTEKTAKTGAHSESLLLNLYHHETSPEHKKLSLLFGLVQYQSSPNGHGWRFFFLPNAKAKSAKAEPMAAK